MHAYTNTNITLIVYSGFLTFGFLETHFESYLSNPSSVLLLLSCKSHKTTMMNKKSTCLISKTFLRKQ